MKEELLPYWSTAVKVGMLDEINLEAGDKKKNKVETGKYSYTPAIKNREGYSLFGNNKKPFLEQKGKAEIRMLSRLRNSSFYFFNPWQKCFIRIIV